MPDTKSGREQKGRNKEAQLHEKLYDKELEVLDGPTEPPLDDDVTGDFIADEPLEDD